MQLKDTRSQLIGIRLQISNNVTQLPNNVKDKINNNDVGIKKKTYRGCISGARTQPIKEKEITTKPINIDRISNSNTIIKGIQHNVQPYICNCPNRKVGIHKLATCTLLKTKRTYAQIVKSVSVPKPCTRKTNKVQYTVQQQHCACHNRKHGIHKLATCTLIWTSNVYFRFKG
jgi:hypothetical protein